MIIAGGIALAAVGIFKGIQYLTSETKEGKEESTPEEGQKEEIKQEEKAEIPDQNPDLPTGAEVTSFICPIT